MSLYWCDGADVKRVFAIATLSMAVSAASAAEVRWCSVVERSGADLVYPVIARRAMVFGVVKSRMFFKPSGEVRSLERTSGPELLFSSMKQQMLTWRFKTDATGNEECQAAVVVVFNLDDYAQWRDPEDERLQAPSVLKIEVDGESFPVETVVTTNDPVIRRRKKSSPAQ